MKQNPRTNLFSARGRRLCFFLLLATFAGADNDAHPAQFGGKQHQLPGPTLRR